MADIVRLERPMLEYVQQKAVEGSSLYSTFWLYHSRHQGLTRRQHRIVRRDFRTERGLIQV